MNKTSYSSQENETLKSRSNNILNDTNNDSNDISIQNQTLPEENIGNNDNYNSWYQKGFDK